MDRGPSSTSSGAPSRLRRPPAPVAVPLDPFIRGDLHGESPEFPRVRKKQRPCRLIFRIDRHRVRHFHSLRRPGPGRRRVLGQRVGRTRPHQPDPGNLQPALFSRKSERRSRRRIRHPPAAEEHAGQGVARSNCLRFMGMKFPPERKPITFASRKSRVAVQLKTGLQTAIIFDGIFCRISASIGVRPIKIGQFDERPDKEGGRP